MSDDPSDRAFHARLAALQGRGEAFRDPMLANVRATSRFACEAFLSRDGADCHAKLFGLAGAASLRPWLEEGVNDVAELARRDYEAEFGFAWRDEWQRRQDDAFDVLEVRFGEAWPAILGDQIASQHQGGKPASLTAARPPARHVPEALASTGAIRATAP